VERRHCAVAAGAALDSAEEQELNREMFVRGFDGENQPSPPLGALFYQSIFSCEQSASPVLERGPPQAGSRIRKQWTDDIRKVQVIIEILQSRVQLDQFVL
jgi:hypothetical protein